MPKSGFAILITVVSMASLGCAQGIVPAAKASPPLKQAVQKPKPAPQPAATGEVAAPGFGEVAAPSFGEVAAPALGNAVATPAPAPAAALAPAPPPPANSPQPQGLTWGEQAVLRAGLHYQPSGWSGRYYALIKGRLDKWDFYSDGTCLHEGVSNYAGFAGENDDRCVYTLNSNGTMTLQFAPPESGFVTGNAAGASQRQAPPPETVPVQMIGPKGSKGLVLGTEQLQWRDWQ